MISNKMRNTNIDCILRYFLNFLENITSFKKIRDELDCSTRFDDMVKLYTDDIIVYSKISLISILFNLNFNLEKPKVLPKEFLKKLYKTYKEELNDDQKTKRQIVTIVVSASALEANHKAIIKSSFYTQFKRNINDFYDQLVEADEEVELFGLVNIILNQNQMHLVYQDLKNSQDRSQKQQN
jgi:tRNA uridine 5-carbamoylmethylation protein Kti12